MLGFKISYSEYFCHTDCYLGNQDCKLWSTCTLRLPDLWINKFWPLRYVFATLLVMYTMIVRWRNSLSALLLLKWITKSCWNFGESVSESKHICQCDRFIFCILLWVHHNSMLLTLRKKFICSTVLHTIRIASHRNSRQHFPSQWDLLVK